MNGKPKLANIGNIHNRTNQVPLLLRGGQGVCSEFKQIFR